VSYAGLWEGQHFLPLEDFIVRARMLGFDGVEIMAKRPHLSPLDYDSPRLRQVRDLLTEHSLQCVCLAAYNDFAAEESFLPYVEFQLVYIEQLCKMAQELGCRMIRVFTGYERKNAPFFTQRNRCVAGIRESCRIAERYGVAIGIQNHHDIAVDASSLRDFIGEVDMQNCMAMLDAWAPAAQGRDFRQEIQALNGKIIHTTAADYKIIKRLNYQPSLVNYTEDTPLLGAVPMGEGFINYPDFFAHLYKGGYDGYVCYEMCSPLLGGGSLENLDRYARAFLSYMKENGKDGV